jgi:3-hydroxyisobutyrate dehydrogenase-like beta-hydroxyacid dehydrogenase
MGKNVIHVGPNGNGLSAKICNNLLAAIRWSYIKTKFELI